MSVRTTQKLYDKLPSEPRERALSGSSVASNNRDEGYGTNGLVEKRCLSCNRKLHMKPVGRVGRLACYSRPRSYVRLHKKPNSLEAVTPSYTVVLLELAILLYQ